MMKRRISYFCGIFFLGIGAALAQDAPTGEIEDAQIIIEKDKPLTLPKANRIYKKTEVLPVQQESTVLEYNLSQPGYSFEPFSYNLNIRDYQSEGAESTSQNYVKAGFGNYVSPLLQGYYGYAEENKKAGVYVFHESFAKGPVRGKESGYGMTDVILSGDVKAEAFTFTPKIAFERETYYFYGYDKDALEASTPDEDYPFYIDDKIGLNNWDISARLSSNSVQGMAIEVTPSFGFTTMGLAGETAMNTDLNFGIEGDLSYAFSDKLTGNLQTEYDFLQYKSDIIQSRNLFQLAPNVRFKEKYFTFKAGLKVAINSDSSDRSSIYVYPDLSAAYEITDELSVFAEVSGGMTPFSLNDARLTNRYLEDSLVFANQNNVVSFTGGVQYNLSSELVLRPYIGYKLSKNKALMVPSLSDTSRFMIVYDQGNFGQFDIGVQVKYLNSRSTLLTDISYSAYKPDEIAEAWYLPTTKVNIVYSQVIGKSLTAKANLMIMDGIKGLKPGSQETVDLDVIVDLGAGLSYLINSNFSVFGEFKNMFGTEYERYLNYPTRGFSGKLGFIYRF